jgi:hypothetical protein
MAYCGCQNGRRELPKIRCHFNGMARFLGNSLLDTRTQAGFNFWAMDILKGKFHVFFDTNFKASESVEKILAQLGTRMICEESGRGTSIK